MTPPTTVNLLPHQQRVVQEKAELDVKINALRSFMQTVTFQSLPLKEQGLRHEQFIVMNRYSDILASLINLFEKVSP